MSIQAVAWALDQDLPARPKLVLVSIANHANHTDGYCWLKAETIAAEAACTPRSVYRFIGGLVRNGYLRKAPRKGDDGKQRANDYWILFQREAAEWDWGAEIGEDGDDQAQHEPVEGGEAAATTDSAVADLPHDTASHGPDDSGVPRQPVDSHAVSCGPTDNGVSRKRIAEPSKTKSASSAGARVPGAAPRGYRPPPPQPLGADLGADRVPVKPIFVYEGSRAYEAWAKRKSIENRLGLSPEGKPRWHLVTRANIDGQWKTGWYFPTLFPPTDTGTHGEGTGPPAPA